MMKVVSCLLYNACWLAPRSGQAFLTSARQHARYTKSALNMGCDYYECTHLNIWSKPPSGPSDQVMKPNAAGDFPHKVVLKENETVYQLLKGWRFGTFWIYSPNAKDTDEAKDHDEDEVVIVEKILLEEEREGFWLHEDSEDNIPAKIGAEQKTRYTKEVEQMNRQSRPRFPKLIWEDNEFFVANEVKYEEYITGSTVRITKSYENRLRNSCLVTNEAEEEQEEAHYARFTSMKELEEL